MYPRTTEQERIILELFSGTLCKRCSVVLHLGKHNPPRVNAGGKPTWNAQIGLLTAEGAHHQELGPTNQPGLLPDCVLCNKIREYLPHSVAIGSIQVALARLIDHVILGPKSRVDPLRAYDRLVLEVKGVDAADAPLLDMELGLVGFPGLPCPRMRRILPEKIDYDLLRGWVRQCDSDHADCRGSSDGKALVPGFQVIDCRTRRVVTVASHDLRYVALSYVWGQQEAASSNGSDFPRTIEDSITVTLALGRRYLWVDKYCIDQNDATNKHVQIGMMDVIYSQADITLIATGPGADDGLQGVSRQTRHPQDVIQLGPFCLASFTSLDVVIAKSVWARRGWTFQEGCLSTRRMIFTDHGVVYMCHSMQRWETIEQEVTEEDGQNRGVITHLERILPNLKSLPPDVWWNMLVEEYTSRALSFDEDALHACLGILKALNVSHHWGVKIVEAVSYSNPKPPVMDLYWRSVKPANRRKGFPTWSWTSCAGYKDFGSSGPFGEDASVVEIQTDEKQGQWVNATTITRDQLAKLRDLNSGQRLRVTGAFLKPIWVTQTGENYVRIPALPDKLSVFLDTTAATMVAHEDTEALVIEPNYNDMSPIVMLLYPHGDYYRRFGIAQSSEPRGMSMGALRNAGSRAAWMEHVEVRTIFLE